MTGLQRRNANAGRRSWGESRLLPRAGSRSFEPVFGLGSSLVEALVDFEDTVVPLKAMDSLVFSEKNRSAATAALMDPALICCCFSFGLMRRILAENLFLQFCKLTDPAGGGSRTNLTTNFILEKLNWPESVAKKLQEVNERLRAFRRHIETARSKRIAHADFSSQIERLGNLGQFSEGAEVQFLQDLQTFIDIAYGHFHNGDHRPIADPASIDTYQLIRALGKSVVFDRCTRCSEVERVVAVLDYEDRED